MSDTPTRKRSSNERRSAVTPKRSTALLTKLTESDIPARDWPHMRDRGLSAQSFHPKAQGARLYAETLQETLKVMG